MHPASLCQVLGMQQLCCGTAVGSEEQLAGLPQLLRCLLLSAALFTQMLGICLPCTEHSIALALSAGTRGCTVASCLMATDFWHHLPAPARPGLLVAQTESHADPPQLSNESGTQHHGLLVLRLRPRSAAALAMTRTAMLALPRDASIMQVTFGLRSSGSRCG